MRSFAINVFGALSFTILLMISPYHSVAQDNTAQAGNSDARWIVNCSNRRDPTKLACSMSQVIFAGNPRRRIVSATIADINNIRMLTFTLPHGLNLTKGVSLSVDEKALGDHLIQTADANGAYSRIPLKDDLLNAMKDGNVMTVTVIGSAGKQIGMQMSLDGFSKAIELLN